MLKRSLSAAPLPPAKRLHTERHHVHLPVQKLSFDNSLYDELILCIFSHLSWMDLCLSQTTNRNWGRLAGDNEIWRNLYLKEYGRTRLRGAKGFIGRVDGREVRPLPGRAKTDEFKDWKWMFRISSNWRKGRCLVETYDQPLHTISINTSPHPHSGKFDRATHIILAGSWTIRASSLPSNRPTMVLVGPRSEEQHILMHEPSRPGVSSITALALDQSPPTSGQLSFVCCLSNGEFSVFQFNHTAPSRPSKRATYQPSRRTPRTSTIIQAAYYHPLLVTLSQSFSLCVYDLSANPIRHTQTLSSFTSYPPASLVLSAPSSSDSYKLVLAYSVPVYPGHWSVGATELMISKTSDRPTDTPPNPSLPSFSEDFRYSIPSAMSVTASRSIRAFDVPSGWVDENKLRAMREQWSRKILNVADAQTDGKWVVLAPGDVALSLQGVHSPSPSPSTSGYSSPPSDAASHDFVSSSLHSPTSLQLYRLVLPFQSNAISASPPKLNFVRTLHGQTSPVSALALADGRCVSLGLNGSVWVWDLEGGTGAEVASADECMTAMDLNQECTKDAVSFDERRIITVRAGKVVVRRFDI
ncbi:hypothetical protein B0H34DRAFT_652876 [Crassisporium funariophilum]|nr:hypothetical protein B0H34DRAFT_652876 [Crassisporium funariophilum]